MQRHLEKLKRKIEQRWTHSSLHLSWDGRSVFVSGDSPTAEERHEIGAFIVKSCKKKTGYKGLVNDMTVAGKSEPPMKMPTRTDTKLEGKIFDVVIIGAGVIGCSIARELSKYDLSIAVLEKECDCGMHASSRNDGMIHPGFADNPKSIKGRLNTRGNRLYHKLGKELDFETNWNGSFLLFNSPLLILMLPYMHWRAKKNGVDGDIGYKSRKQVHKMDPHLDAKHYGGFWMPSAGALSPFQATTAFAENASQNGANFFFETVAINFEINDNYINSIQTNRGKLDAKLVINAAGVWSDKIAQFANDRFFSIHPRKGMEIILDKKKGKFQKTMTGMPDLLSSSKKHSKGGGLLPCVEGNVLIGPTAKEVYDREDYSTEPEDLEQLFNQMKINPKLSPSDVITYYSGIRASNWEEDFIVEGSQKVHNLVHAAAIQSPGLASAPAIAEDITQISIERLTQITKKTPIKKQNFQSKRKAPPNLQTLTNKQKNELIKHKSSYGKIVCRCEHISEGEIRDAIKQCITLGMETISLDAIKRRCRVGAGRCHGGFCTPTVMEIISSELNIPLQEITKKGGSSFILSKAMNETSAEVCYDV